MWELETITGDDHLDWNTISHFFWGGAINSYHWNVMMTFVCNFKPVFFFWYFRPYSNLYYKHRAKGIYNCKVCNTSLFLSSTKYDSGSGWPSFFDVIDKAKVTFKADASGSKFFLIKISTLSKNIRNLIFLSMKRKFQRKKSLKHFFFGSGNFDWIFLSSK